MFKTLFISALLAGSVCGVPQAVATPVTNYLQGHYCLKTDYPTDLSIVDHFYADNFSFNYTNDGTNDVYVYAYYGANNYYTAKVDSYLNIYCDDEYFLFHIDYLLAYGDVEQRNTFNYSEGYFDTSDFFQRFYVYFQYPYNVTDEQADFFNTFFTNEGNEYCTRYTGWYTFNNTVNLSYGRSFTVFGNLMVNNGLWMGFSKASDSIVVWTVTPTYVGKVYYSSGSWTSEFKVKNAYFTNVFLTATDESNFNLLGTFNYVPYVQEYTFGEMVFNIIDAPIYMLSQLFSFELFGVQIYYAFMSVVTIVLVCFVLKKII